jgi:aminomethyltransferase
MTDTPRKTPLHGLHLSLNAKMAPFGGFEMPIQYDSIVSEHNATRHGATLFDTCHMGEFHIEGKGAIATLENLVTCKVATLKEGACRYGLMCAEDGGAIDDLLIYRLAEDRFMMVVNAGTQAGDFEWVSQHAMPDTTITNHSDNIAKIDLQGPESVALLNAMIPGAADGLGYFRFRTVSWKGVEVLVSRTGYTGERGYELYLPPDQAEVFWRDAMGLGAIPAGLGARDTLRLECALPLYGHELRRDRNAGITALSRAIATDKPFIGADALREPQTQELAGVKLESPRAARDGDTICNLAGDKVGEITSGSFAPTVGCAIALAVIDSTAAEPGTDLQIQTSRKSLPCKVTPLPFYTGTARDSA